STGVGRRPLSSVTATSLNAISRAPGYRIDHTVSDHSMVMSVSLTARSSAFVIVRDGSMIFTDVPLGSRATATVLARGPKKHPRDAAHTKIIKTCFMAITSREFESVQTAPRTPGPLEPSGLRFRRGSYRTR